VPCLTHIWILACSLTPQSIRLQPSRLCGPFPHPHMLTPTHSTAGLASQTKPPLQSAPSVLYLVRVLAAKTDRVPVVLLGSCLGFRSDKPISHHTHFPYLLEILFLLAHVDERRSPIPLVHGWASSLFPFFVVLTLVSIGNCWDWPIPLQVPLPSTAPVASPTPLQ